MNNKIIKIIVGIIVVIIIVIGGMKLYVNVTKNPIDLGIIYLTSTRYYPEYEKQYGKDNVYRAKIKLEDDNYISAAIVLEDNILLSADFDFTTKSGNILKNHNLGEGELLETEQINEYIINNGKIPPYNELNLKKITEEQYNQLINNLELPTDTFKVNYGKM